jgi:hypothetical protein
MKEEEKIGENNIIDKINNNLEEEKKNLDIKVRVYCKLDLV